MEQGNSIFGTQRISKLLLKLAPPIMAAQLIQALYNIVDSYFIGKFSSDGLSALSVIFPIQLLISAFAIGTGVGVNTVMAKYYGLKREKEARETAGVGIIISVISWIIFAAVSCLIMGVYCKMSLKSVAAQEYAKSYGLIVCAFSIGIFTESNFSKILQAKGDMKTPMTAQIVGALVNIVFDYLLIFGIGKIKPLGVSGAAIATVLGQIIAAIITGLKAYTKPNFKLVKKYIKPIYKAGVPNILMNALCTIYIIALNLILVSFSDEAVTVLGLYYKLQTFLLIPLLALTTCIIPILSFNYAAKKYDRCKKILWETVIFSAICMIIGTLVFELFPKQLLSIFAKGNEQVIKIGINAFRIIAISFTPFSLSLVMPTYFQAIGKNAQSIFISVLRQIILLVPLAWIFSKFGLQYVWLTFPITEFIDALASYLLYLKYGRANIKAQGLTN